jgi:hypothetical protein
MNNAGVFTLGSVALTAAKSLSIITPIINLDGMSAISLECNFQWGAGGTSATAIVATSLDGTLWRHIARFDFTTAALVKTANLSGLTPKGIASYADLAAEGVTDGFLGNQIALLVSSVGTYSNTLLTCRASVR